MQKAKLMFWQIEKISDTERRLSGLVFGHPNFRDGEVVTTSPVEKIEERIATTRNTVYELGDLGTHNRMLFEVRELNDKLSRVKDQAMKQIETLDKQVDKLLVIMQAAIIEWEYGKGPEAALQWIANTLDGPGLIPDPSEPYGKNAQLFFNANRPDPSPKCFCGNPSHIEWMGQGFCCEAHYQEAKAKHEAGKSAI